MHDSSFGRPVSVLTSPSATFRSIAERPTAAVALILLILLGCVAGVAMTSKMDTEDLVRAQLEQSGQELSHEEMDGAIAFGEKMKYIGPTVGIAFVFPLLCLVGAGLVLVILRILGSEIAFRQSFSTFVHGMVPGGVKSLLALPVILSRGEIPPEAAQSGPPLMSNLAFLAGDDAGPTVLAALSSVDVFSVWSIALLVIGYSIVGGVSRSKATGAVLVVWLVGVAIKIGLASLGG